MIDDIVNACAGQITLPKVLVIQNFKLGWSLRVMQLLATAWVINNIVWARAWLVGYVPVDYGIEAWIKRGPTEKMDNSSVQHCSDPSSFDYVYSSSFAYSFTRCVPLQLGEAFSLGKMSSFIPTSLQENLVSQASGAAACADLKANCAAKGGTFVADQCQCTEEYFDLVKNAEHMLFHFNHGYEVNVDGTIYRGRDKSNAVQSTDMSTWTPVESDHSQLLTIVQRWDGSECAVGEARAGGALARWHQADVVDGITGSLQEWLACAGMSLDDVDTALGSGAAGEVGEPRYRITGLVLKLDLNYHNAYHQDHAEASEGVVCYVRVSVLPTWTYEDRMAYSTVPDRASAAGAFRYRHQYGVSIQISAKGEFSHWDYNAVITAFVNALVILSLPSMIIQYITVYGMGPVSRIYRRAQAKVFSIRGQMFGFATRAMAGAQSFKDIVGDSDGVMTKDHLRSRIREAFYKSIEDETLEDDELEAIVESLHADGLAAGATAGIRLAEFLDGFLSSDILKLREMASFFDRDRRQGVLERVLAEQKGAAKATSSPPPRAKQKTPPVTTTKVHPVTAWQDSNW